MNTCAMVGKVLSEPHIRDSAKNKPVYQILVEIDRPFKMSDGSVKKDIFPVALWKGLADECKDICQPGDILAIKGRMESECRKVNDKDEFYTTIIAEKVTFIKSKDKSWQITC